MEPLGMVAVPFWERPYPFILPINGCGNPWHWFNIFHPYWGYDI